MNLVVIDISKNSHHFRITDKYSGEILDTPASSKYNKEWHQCVIKQLKPYSKKSILIDMEDTLHCHFALHQYLLNKDYNVVLVNPKTTDHIASYNEASLILI